MFHNLPDAILNLIFEFTYSGPYILFYDVKTKQLIRKINPNYSQLKRVNEYKICHMPQMNTKYDLDNTEKTVSLQFTLPLKIPENKKFNENKFIVIEYVFTVNLNTMIPYLCTIIVPHYYHFITRDYVKMHQSLYPTTIRNFYLYKGLRNYNYGYDSIIS